MPYIIDAKQVPFFLGEVVYSVRKFNTHIHTQTHKRLTTHAARDQPSQTQSNKKKKRKEKKRNILCVASHLFSTPPPLPTAHTPLAAVKEPLLKKKNTPQKKQPKTKQKSLDLPHI